MGGGGGEDESFEITGTAMYNTLGKRRDLEAYSHIEYF